MDIQKATKGSKRTGSGFITVKQKDGEEYRLTDVDLHDFGDDKGGLMVGSDSEARHVIGFGYPARSMDGQQTVHYKKDYSGFYLTWSYSDQKGPRHIACKGELSVTFSNHLTEAEGSYWFETEDHTKFEGKFHLKAG